MFWVPQSGDIGVGVSILTYAGGVQFGLITDAQLCPDPQAIIDRFAAGVREAAAGDADAAVGARRELSARHSSSSAFAISTSSRSIASSGSHAAASA